MPVSSASRKAGQRVTLTMTRVHADGTRSLRERRTEESYRDRHGVHRNRTIKREFFRPDGTPCSQREAYTDDEWTEVLKARTRAAKKPSFWARFLTWLMR